MRVRGSCARRRDGGSVVFVSAGGTSPNPHVYEPKSIRRHDCCSSTFIVFFMCSHHLADDVEMVRNMIGACCLHCTVLVRLSLLESETFAF